MPWKKNEPELSNNQSAVDSDHDMLSTHEDDSHSNATLSMSADEEKTHESTRSVNNAKRQPSVPKVNSPSSESQLIGQSLHALNQRFDDYIKEQKRGRRWRIFFKLAFFGLFAFILVSLFSGYKTAYSTAPSAALVRLEGVIASDSQASANNVIYGLRQAFKSNSKGVILSINSPGGSPVQSQQIYDEARLLSQKYSDKPFIAVITDAGASGAYYAAVAAPIIYASKSSIVGSIGVRMDGFGFTELMEKAGIERRLLTAGESKGVLDPFLPVNPAEKTHIESVLNGVHQEFIDVVKEGRQNKLDLSQSKTLFSGLFWNGEQALTLGLIDGIKSPIRVAREDLGVENIVDYTVYESYFQQFSKQLTSMIYSQFKASQAKIEM